MNGKVVPEGIVIKSTVGVVTESDVAVYLLCHLQFCPQVKDPQMHIQSFRRTFASVRDVAMRKQRDEGGKFRLKHFLVQGRDGLTFCLEHKTERGVVVRCAEVTVKRKALVLWYSNYKGPSVSSLNGVQAKLARSAEEDAELLAMIASEEADQKTPETAKVEPSVVITLAASA